jgi:23S rRNA (uracil1939-C5)-methyltransferase
LWGTPFVTDTLKGATLTRHARAFFQGNRYLLDTLVTRILSVVPAAPMLDLYAGVGLFAATLAVRGDTPIVAVEGDSVAAEDLKRNLAAFAPAATACHDSVEAFFASRRARQPFRTVIVDPPRTGMSRDALTGIVKLKPARIVYVSCDVATLARDLKALSSSGYRMSSVEAFDMFPHTAHVETLAVLDAGAV